MLWPPIRFVFRRCSLRQTARSEGQRKWPAPTLHRLDGTFRTIGEYAIGHDLTFVWLLFAAILATFLPMPGSHFGELASSTLARNFLRDLWQVEAAVLVLSVAVILFAFQAVASTRSGASVREFAEDSWLLQILYLGFLGLLVDGLVLLGVGHGGVEGWPGTWAALLSFGGLFSLPLLFARAIRSVDPTSLHRHRLKRFLRAIRRSVEADRLDLAALRVLQVRSKESGIEYSLYNLAGLLRNWHVIKPKRAGIVDDLNLCGFKSITQRSDAEAAATFAPRISVRLGQAVSSDSVVLMLAPSSTRRALRAGRNIVRIRRPPTRNRLTQAVERLHGEAIGAITQSDLNGYRLIADAYFVTITAFPEAWAVFGIRLSHSLMQELYPMGFSSIDHMKRNLYQQIRAIAASGNRELADLAIAIPYRVSASAVEEGSDFVFNSMLDLLVQVHRVFAS